VLAGHWLRAAYSQKRKLLGLVVAGVASLGAGLVWSLAFPIVKNLWSSSFVLFAGGWSLLLLALFYGVIDVLGYRKWAFVFTVIGANSITIYLARHFLNFKEVGLIFTHGFINYLGGWKPFAIELGSVVAPRRSRKMTHVCSLKVTRIESTSMHTDLNLFLHCERQRSCLLYLLDERVDTL
jgi:hypothetical protein